MRWNPFRSGTGPDASPEDNPARSSQRQPDKITLAISQRRMFTAQQRVDQLLGFAKVERRWCDPPTADELDARVVDLPAEGTRRQWADEKELVEAVRAASSRVGTGSGFAFVRDEPEARWVEAPLRDLLTATAAALDSLRDGITLVNGDHVFSVDIRARAAGRAYETTSRGDWPPATA